MPEMRFSVLRVKQWWEVIFFGKQGDAAENTHSQILPTLFENDLVFKKSHCSVGLRILYLSQIYNN